jgi:hypothetical protein
MAPEELTAVSYETGQAPETTDESCTGVLRSCKDIGNQIAKRGAKIGSNEFYNE